MAAVPCGQFVDVLWAFFVLTGIEKVRIVPGITATNPLDLYYMPYTHSLVGSLVWSLLLFGIYRYLRPTPKGAALLVGAAVFSHWILDLIVHRPDLAIYDDAVKVGLGLWDYPALSFGLEIFLLFGGIFLYMRSTSSSTKIGTFGVPILGIALVAVQSMVFFGAPPETPSAAAVMALFAYFLFAILVFWLERYRS